MTHQESDFLTTSRQKAFDLDHRRKMNYSLKQSDMAFQKGKLQFPDLNAARNHANRKKWETIENLGIYLQEFESNFLKAGGKIIWAQTAEQALQAILKICKEKGAKSIVKSKSMVTEEIHLNKFLQNNEVEVIETDLGEYIQQLDGEAPYHIVAPSLHKSKEDVARLFHEKLHTDPELQPEELTLVAREVLRKKYQQAEIGITGANFLLADVGGVVVTENEGNARLSTSFPKTHIVITGIEKVLPSINDLQSFLPLLATFGSGQKVTVYNTIFFGPRTAAEVDGPEEMYIILLDNGRTNILANPEVRESLYCIRCGACLNDCPVYKTIGGHAYGSVYSGPIGSVITPHLRGLAGYKHLSFASTLCGKCTEVCPVRINLHELLLINRRKSVEEGNTNSSENAGWFVWKLTSRNRWMLNVTGGNLKNIVIKKLFKKLWGPHREFPVFARQSFNVIWRKKKTIKS